MRFCKNIILGRYLEGLFSPERNGRIFLEI